MKLRKMYFYSGNIGFNGVYIVVQRGWDIGLTAIPHLKYESNYVGTVCKKYHKVPEVEISFQVPAPNNTKTKNIL